MDAWEGPIIPEYQNLVAQFETGQLFDLSPIPDDVISIGERHPDVWWSNTKATITSILYFDHTMTTDQPWRYSLLRKGLGFIHSLKPHLLSHAGFYRRFQDVPIYYYLLKAKAIKDKSFNRLGIISDKRS